MKNFFQIFILIFISFLNSAFATQPSQLPEPPVKLNSQQLELIAQPIALYPDTLLQQVLAASTFPEQILDAALYNEQGKDPQAIKNQPWDDSVKATANYPSVLTKMASDIDWTISLGSAYVNQTDDLRKAIQTLRSKAKTLGNLDSSAQQSVIAEKTSNGTNIIRIESTDPAVIYVPTTTTVIYQEPVKDDADIWAPIATFGLGMALGYAMGDDDDDHYYYGGPGFWYGGGAADNWVDHRREQWDDVNDFARDRQDWRQDNRDDWREYRQDLGRKQSEWRQTREKNPANLTPEKRAEAKSRFDQAKSSGKFNSSTLPSKGNFSTTSSTINKNNVSRDQVNLRLNDAKNNPQLKQKAQQYQNNPQVQQRLQNPRENSQFGSRPSSLESKKGSYDRGSGLSGMNRGSRSTTATQMRGSASRSSFGGGSDSRGSFSGGGARMGGGGRRR